MFGTNHRGYESDRPCPECPNESLELTLKQEATLFKFWFDCRSCGWESRTYRGPSVDGGELGEDAGADKYARKTRDKAKEVTLQ